MSILLNSMLSSMKMVSKNRISVCCALLAALTCGTVVGEKRMPVKTAFLDENDLSVPPQPPMAPPAPPQSHTKKPGANGKSSNHNTRQATEVLPPGRSSAPIAWEDSYPVHGYVDRPMWHWPGIAPLHRRWVTTTKPRLQASHWGYPEYFEERPFGSYALQAEQMQIMNGVQNQQVLYNYDFLDGDHSDTLSPRGQYQLQKIIRRMEIAPCPIILQTTVENNELNESRRQNVLTALSEAGVDVYPEMVVVDRPPVPGLNGQEGLRIYDNLLLETEERGEMFDFDTSLDIQR